MQGAATRPPAGILTGRFALNAAHRAAELEHFPVVTKLSRAKFHNSRAVAGVTNGVRVRGTGATATQFVVGFLFQICGSEIRDVSGWNRDRTEDLKMSERAR